MIEALQKLIAALRDELQHYGEMLARLDDQQQLVMRRTPEVLLQTIPHVQQQSTILTQAREVRFGAMKYLCATLGISHESSFKDLMPHLPSDYRPLVDALIQENNELLMRIHQRARQNHLLLARTVESMQRVINSLGIHRTTPVYDESGSMFNPPPATSSLYEAVC
jgi:hypothetical protein